MNEDNGAKELASVSRMPICDVCGKVMRHDHDQCDQFASERRMHRKALKRILFGHVSENGKVGLLKLYDEIGNADDMLVFISAIQRLLNANDHDRYNALYGIHLGFMCNCANARNDIRLF